MAGSDTLIGQTMSQYRIVESLGVGGMGAVYKAEDTALDRVVGPKSLQYDLPKDAPTPEGLRREARAASALNH